MHDSIANISVTSLHRPPNTLMTFTSEMLPFIPQADCRLSMGAKGLSRRKVQYCIKFSQQNSPGELAAPVSPASPCRPRLRAVSCYVSSASCPRPRPALVPVLPSSPSSPRPSPPPRHPHHRTRVLAARPGPASARFARAHQSGPLVQAEQLEPLLELLACIVIDMATWGSYTQAQAQAQARTQATAGDSMRASFHAPTRSVRAFWCGTSTSSSSAGHPGMVERRTA